MIAHEGIRQFVPARPWNGSPYWTTFFTNQGANTTAEMTQNNAKSRITFGVRRLDAALLFDPQRARISEKTNAAVRSPLLNRMAM